MTAVDSAIRAELYRALQKLGAGSDLLSIVGGWGETWGEDYDVLRGLRCWNAGRDAEPYLVAYRCVLVGPRSQ